MKYLVRSIKYFFYLAIMLALVVFVLIKLHIVEGDLSTLFVNGYDSYWQMAIIMAVFALIYPRFGYASRDVTVPGETSEIQPEIIKVMDRRGYKVSDLSGDDMIFIKRSPLDRAMKMWEDALTFVRTATGYSVEGHNREVVRAISAITSEPSLSFPNGSEQ